MHSTLAPTLTHHWVSRAGLLVILIADFCSQQQNRQSRGAVCHAYKPDEVGRFDFRLTSLNKVPSIFIRLVQVRAS